MAKFSFIKNKSDENRSAKTPKIGINKVCFEKLFKIPSKVPFLTWVRSHGHVLLILRPSFPMRLYLHPCRLSGREGIL